MTHGVKLAAGGDRLLAGVDVVVGGEPPGAGQGDVALGDIEEAKPTTMGAAACVRGASEHSRGGVQRLAWLDVRRLYACGPNVKSDRLVPLRTSCVLFGL